jgi:hypothetical protein
MGVVAAINFVQVTKNVAYVPQETDMLYQFSAREALCFYYGSHHYAPMLLRPFSAMIRSHCPGTLFFLFISFTTSHFATHIDRCMFVRVRARVGVGCVGVCVMPSTDGTPAIARLEARMEFDRPDAG